MVSGAHAAGCAGVLHQLPTEGLKGDAHICRSGIYPKCRMAPHAASSSRLQIAVSSEVL